MKIALGQINTTVGDFEGNVRKIIDYSQKGRARGAELILFPELAIPGYPPRDLVDNPSFVLKNLNALDDVARSVPEIPIVVGYIGINSASGAKPLFNSAAVVHKGKIVHTYNKMLLPSYDVFDEGRHFEAGRTVSHCIVNGIKIGVTICEDMWNDKLFLDKRFYQLDPIEEEVNAGVQVLVNISASPFSAGKVEVRRSLVEALALKHGVPFVFANLVGGNDELVFDGHSLAVDDKGMIMAEAKGFQEDLVVADFKGPARKDEPKDDEIADIYRALVLGVQDYVAKCGFKKVVIGLSGGIDSSLVAVIAHDALGAENVLGVTMPSQFNAKDGIDDVRGLAESLKIELLTIPIEGVYKTYSDILTGPLDGFPTDITGQNVQARIRGNILMALSNKRRHLLLSTGNKSELAVGYCTLYGDMSGGLAVISDLPKTLVYKVGRCINKERGVIPERIFTRPPSAELCPDQKDQDDLPPYEILDQILISYIEEYKGIDDIIGKGLDPEIVRRIVRMVDQNEYKRRQAPPGIRVTSKAFGMGRRYPIARKI